MWMPARWKAGVQEVLRNEAGVLVSVRVSYPHNNPVIHTYRELIHIRGPRKSGWRRGLPL